MSNFLATEQVFFYNSSDRDRLRDVSILIENLYLRNNRILVLSSDQETASILDNFLWIYKEESFVPHSMQPNENGFPTPVFITTNIDEFHRYQTLLSINGILIENQKWAGFKKIYYFFSENDINEKQNARLMWKNFSSQNLVCKYWTYKNRKWVLQHSI
ncbi:DNA polymerase III subunit chi [Paracoccaceae bacterium]|nr:DNA polymerase III subunit chi [Paracoccaceae bacterium]